MSTRNRLAQETSPYLRQHEENPVDWYTWGPEALKRAKELDRPILLSIGYSACHWCHVMAHESFENPEIAALMNSGFINIKVDREERPDLDQIYQNVAQAITRGGGWPLTVFLLPDGRPFFGGTYFPPEDRWGRPGFPRLLRSLSEAYRTDRASVEENAEKLTGFIAELERNAHPSLENHSLETIEPSRALLDRIEEKMRDGIDLENGGFGAAPKFPNTMMLSFLLRMRSPDSLEGVRLSLVKMAKGGIFDQLGGGFHRYSVDDKWAVPHFEKMLYDNGLLLQLYSEALLSRPREDDRALFIKNVKKTAEYLLREMEHPDGGFYAAQDADTEGEEGKTFVFDLKEFESLLDSLEAKILAMRFGVNESGNFEHGKTVLYQAMDESEIASTLGRSITEVRSVLARGEEKLFEGREKRPKPGLDDKLLIGWNGLAISGLAWAAHVLEQEAETIFAQKIKTAAIRAFERIVSVSASTEGKLPATIQRGEPKGQGFLDDYAFMARAALDLARFGVETVSGESPLHWAEVWTRRVLTSFSDPSGDPGFFFTGDDHEKLLQRPKSLYDQAIPSGTAVVCANLITLSELLERPGNLGIEGRSLLEKLAPHLERNPYGYGELASTLRLYSEGIRTFAGDQANGAIRSDRDFVVRDLAKEAASDFKVCARGVCTRYTSFEEWKSASAKESTA